MNAVFCVILVCSLLCGQSFLFQNFRNTGLLSQPHLLKMAAELTEDEVQLLASHFKTLGLKPKLDTPEELQRWMEDYVKAVSMDEEDEEEQGLEPEPENPVKPGPVGNLATITQLPRVSTFSGELSSKTDAPFDLWKYEVSCLLAEGTYSTNVILHAVRKSLRGEAGRIAMRLGTSASIQELLDKLEGVYGTVHRGQTLLADFYSAQQGEIESVATWGCRLEDLLDKACKKGQVNPSGVDEMLRTKFWTGLKPALKDRSSHKFDSCKTFDDLRVQLRMIEHEMQGDSSKVAAKDAAKDAAKKPVQVKAVTSKELPSSEIGELKGLIQKLSGRIDELQSKVQLQPSSDVPKRQASNSQSSDGGFVCWRCGQEGHVRSGCRVRLDHLKRAPNERQPAPRGGEQAGRN